VSNANFQFSWWSRDQFSAPFRGLYLLIYACSQTLQLSKDTPSEFRLSVGTIGLGVKLFPVGCAQDSRRVPQNTKNAVFWIWLRPRYKTTEFSTIAPVLTTLTVCRQNRGDIRRLYIGLRVLYKYYKKTVVLVWPRAAHVPIAV